MPKARHRGTPPSLPFEDLLSKARQALEAGDAASAESLFGQATVARPASAEAWYGKGAAFARGEQWDKALRCFSVAVKFDPKHAAAWLGRARAYLGLGEKAKAREDLARAEALDPGNPALAELRAASA